MNTIASGHYNISRVLRLLWQKPGISRVEIAKVLGLNRSTITHIIHELMRYGLVKTLSIGQSTPQGGRKKVRLGIDKEYGGVVGLELHAEFTRVIMVNLYGEILYEHLLEQPASGPQFYSAVRSAYHHIRTKANRMKWRLLGVGCGVGGIVNPVTGEIWRSIPLQIVQSEPVRERVQSFVQEPFFIDNDANCCCWGELAWQKQKEPSEFLFILGEWRQIQPGADQVGIGLGVVIGNRVHYGKYFSAGEFRSIEWKVGNLSQFSLADREIGAARNDRAVFLAMVEELARHTALLVNVLNLSRLYLGGFFQEDDPQVKQIFEEEIQKNWTYPNMTSCEVVFSTMGPKAVAYGAAGMVLQKIFGNASISSLDEQEDGFTLLVEGQHARPRGVLPRQSGKPRQARKGASASSLPVD